MKTINDYVAELDFQRYLIKNNGAFIIEGLIFSPVVILKRVEPELYQELFKRWLNARNVTQLILSKINHNSTTQPKE